MINRSKWIPEIVYEGDEEEQFGSLPMIHVPPSETMPNVLFIWEVQETGEFEPGLNGEEVPVIEMDLRQYVMMDSLKAAVKNGKLTLEDLNKVRTALGLKPLAEAVALGHQITQNVRDSVAHNELKASGNDKF